MTSKLFTVRENQPRKSDQPYTPNYRKHKSSLRQDFNKCCGYCGVKDRYFWQGKGFHIDHFAPLSKFKSQPRVVNDYSNLVYSCPVCNIAKSNAWPSNDIDVPILNGEGFIDPSGPNYENYFYRTSEGKIRYKEGESVAEYMHRQLRFYLFRHELFWVYDYLDSATQKLNDVARTISDQKEKGDIQDYISDLIAYKKQITPYVDNPE